MEARLILFLALVSFVMIGNAVAVFLAYKALANMTTTVATAIQEFTASEETKKWIESVEAASAQAVSITNAAKAQVTEFEPVLAQAQTTFEFRLAQLDVRFERVCEAVSRQAEKTQGAILEPVEKIGAAAANVGDVLQFSQLLGAAPSVDASSTPKK